jgi:hypothetical protein
MPSDSTKPSDLMRMNENSENIDVLIAVYEGQRSESLQHRQSMLNAFSLSLTGLLALAAGVLAAPNLDIKLRCLLAFVVFVVCVTMTRLIQKQRIESEKGMSIMRKIEAHLRLFTKGGVIPNETILPPSFAKSMRLTCGLNGADWLQAGTLLIVGVGIVFLLAWLP